MDYGKFYAKLSRPFTDHPALAMVIRVLNHLIELVMYGAYVVILGGILLTMDSYSLAELWKDIGPFVVIPGVSFILLSLVRHLINAPRPYEQWPINPVITREKTGDSMPSRHVFSATVIAMCLLRIEFILGILALILAGVLAIIRVVGGVHYPKDVLVGFVVGLLAGGLLFL